MSILEKKITGLLAIFGSFAVLFLKIFFDFSFMETAILFFVLVLTLVFFLNPFAGLLTLIFLRPAADAFSSDLQLNLNENISINVASLLGIFLIFLTGIFFLKNRRLFFSIPALFPMIFFIAVLGASIAFSIEPFASLYETVRVAGIFAVFALAFALTDSEKKFRQIIAVILFSAIIPATTAFYQLITGSGLGGTDDIESRLFGTFAHPNSFASFLLIIFSLFFFLVLRQKEKWRIKTFLWLGLGFFSFLLLETYSRGAWLGLATFIFLYGFLRSPKIIALFLFSVFTLFFFSQTFHDRVEDIYNPPADSSIVWRMQKWHLVLDTWKNKPFLGSGAGTEIEAHEANYGFYAGNPYTHNDFLKIILENGIIGLLIYSILLLNLFLYLLRSYLNAVEKNQKDFILVVFLLLFAQTIFSLSSNIWRGTAAMWILWMLIGVALTISKEKTVTPEQL